MITCTILVDDLMTTMLFYLGSSYSYESVNFAQGLELICYTLDAHIYVVTPIGKFVVVTTCIVIVLCCLWA